LKRHLFDRGLLVRPLDIAEEFATLPDQRDFRAARKVFFVGFPDDAISSPTSGTLLIAG
jgi:hypothetical protein